MAELTMENPLTPSRTSAVNKAVQDLKECVGKLKEEFEDYHIPVNDDNKDLHRFCAKLEFLFQTGMKVKTTLLGAKKDYWNYMQDCLSSNKSLRDGIKFVNSLKDLKTNTGRGRALVRFALMHQTLADTVQQCVINGKVTSDWYHPKSVWLQHKLSSELVSTLYDLGDVQFDLSPHGYDLDNSWPSFARKTFGSPASGMWQPPSRSTSIASLQSIPQLDINPNIPAPESPQKALMSELSCSVQEENDEEIVLAMEKEAEQLRNQIAELEDENQAMQKKCNDYEVQREKATNELSLKSEVWQEKEEFYKLKQEDSDKAISTLQEKLQLVEESISASQESSESDLVELRDKLAASEKQCADRQLELDSLQKEHCSKLEIEEAKSEMMDMQEKRIEQLKHENQIQAEQLEKEKTEVKLMDMQEKRIEQLKHENQIQAEQLEKEREEVKSAMISLSEAKQDAIAEQQKAKLMEASSTADQLEIKTLQEKVSFLEKAYNDVTQHNKELKSMLHSLEDKCKEITTLAKEKVLSYQQENQTLKKSMQGMEVSLQELQKAAQERKEVESQMKALGNSGDQREENNQDGIDGAVAQLPPDDGSSDGETPGEKLAENTEKQSNDGKSTAENFEADTNVGDEISSQNITESTQSASAEVSYLEAGTNQEVTQDAVVEMQQLMEQVKKENQDVINSLHEEIQNITREVELLRKQNKELDESMTEHAKLLKEAQDALLEQQEANKEESKEIKNVICGIRDSVASQVLSSDLSETIPSSEDEKKDESLHQFISSFGTSVQQVLQQVLDERNKSEVNCKEKEGDIEKLKEGKQKLAVKIDKIEQQCDELIQQIETLTGHDQDLQAKLDLSEKQNEETSKQLEEYGKKLNEMKSGLGDANAIQDEVFKQLDQANASLEEKDKTISSLEDQIIAAKTETAQKTGEIEDLKSKIVEAQETIADLEEGKLEMSETANKSYFELKERLGQSVCENDALREEIQRVTGEKEEYFQSWNVENTALKEQVQKLSTETEQLTDKTTDLEAEVKKLQSEREELTNDLSQKDSENIALKEQVQKLSTETEQLTYKTAELEEEVKKLQSERDELASDLTKKDSKLEEHLAKIDRLMLDLQDADKNLTGKQSETQDKLSDLEEEIKKYQQEIDSKKREMAAQSQEISALQFQLSSQQIQQENQLQTYASQQDEITASADKIMQQEAFIETLQLQLTETKNENEARDERHKRELEDVQQYARKEEDKVRELNIQIKEKADVYMSLQHKHQEEMKSANEQHMNIIATLQADVKQLNTDNLLLKKKLIQVTRDKDQLWQKTDMLTYQQKLKATEKWMDSSITTHCLRCATEFSFLLRKHHCRLCGKIYCDDCCNTWVMTAHSSKKERVCALCMLNQSQLEATSDGEDSSDDEIQNTIEVPQRQSQKWLSLPQGDDSTPGSSPPEADTIEVVLEGHSSDQVPPDTSGSVPSNEGSDSQLAGSASCDTETYDVITPEEVQQTISDPVPDPSMYSSGVFCVEELEEKEMENEPELWITAGRSYAVPVRIHHAGMTLKWEFTTYPKDINFSLLFSSTAPDASDEELIPLCKCNSHKKAIQGELAAHQAGIYTLIFDNKASRFTAKKLMYKVQVLPPASEVVD